MVKSVTPLQEFIYSSSKLDAYLDASAKPGMTELEHSLQNTLNSGVWFSYVKRKVGLIFLPIESSSMEPGMKAFRRFGVAHVTWEPRIALLKESKECAGETIILVEENLLFSLT